MNTTSRHGFVKSNSGGVYKGGNQPTGGRKHRHEFVSAGDYNSKVKVTSLIVLTVGTLAACGIISLIANLAGG